MVRVSHHALSATLEFIKFLESVVYLVHLTVLGSSGVRYPN